MSLQGTCDLDLLYVNLIFKPKFTYNASHGLHVVSKKVMHK